MLVLAVKDVFQVDAFGCDHLVHTLDFEADLFAVPLLNDGVVGHELADAEHLGFARKLGIAVLNRCHLGLLLIPRDLEYDFERVAFFG